MQVELEHAAHSAQSQCISACILNCSSSSSQAVWEGLRAIGPYRAELRLAALRWPCFPCSGVVDLPAHLRRPAAVHLPGVETATAHKCGALVQMVLQIAETRQHHKAQKGPDHINHICKPPCTLSPTLCPHTVLPAQDLWHLFVGVTAGSAQYWLYVLLVPVACMLPDFFYRSVKR